MSYNRVMCSRNLMQSGHGLPTLPFYFETDM